MRGVAISARVAISSDNEYTINAATRSANNRNRFFPQTNKRAESTHKFTQHHCDMGFWHIFEYGCHNTVSPQKKINKIESKTIHIPTFRIKDSDQSRTDIGNAYVPLHLRQIYGKRTVTSDSGANRPNCQQITSAIYVPACFFQCNNKVRFV